MTKWEHALEMKYMQLQISRENTKKDTNTEAFAEKRSVIAMDLEKVKNAELKARRKYTDELVVNQAKKKKNMKKARDCQVLDNLNTTWMNAIPGGNHIIKVGWWVQTTQ